MPNLYLVGFMGVGKSTTGKQIAKKLKLQFIDSDAVIETVKQKTVTQIFEEEGESAFRILEQQFIETHPKTGCVVACGGGLLIPQGSLELLQSLGVVVCLFASPETILARTQHRSTRPLLNVENKKETIEELLAARERKYSKISNAVATENRPVPEIVKHVIRIYLREKAKFSISPSKPE